MNDSVFREAFDRHASTYDSQFSSTDLGQQIRRDVWTIAEKYIPSNVHLLDIGAGTGEDSIHFAKRGATVTALDVSSEMTRVLKQKAHIAGMGDRITTIAVDAHAYIPESPIGAVLSNFGALNCMRDLTWMRRLAQRSLLPGAVMVLVAMGRLYPLETTINLIRLRPRQAFRRLGRAMARIEGIAVPVFYHSPHSMRQAFGSDFTLLELTGMRCALPVPGFEHVQRYLPMRVLRPIDRLVTHNRRTATLADHFVSVWKYR